MPVDFHDMSITADIIFLPQPFLDFDKAQEIFTSISSETGMCVFQHLGNKAVMETPPEEKYGSRLVLLKDRISFSSSVVSGVSSIDEPIFRKNLIFVTKECFNRINIPFSVTRVWQIEVLLPISQLESGEISDTREFLAEHAMGLNAERQILPYFGRPAQTFGLRLVFPPNLGAPEDLLNSFDLRLESYNRDSKYFFINNSATFPVPMFKGNYDLLDKELEEAERFVKENVRKFLSQFDSNAQGE